MRENKMHAYYTRIHKICVEKSIDRMIDFIIYEWKVVLPMKEELNNVD